MKTQFFIVSLLAAAFQAAGAPVNLVCTDQKQGGALRWQVDPEAKTVSYLGNMPAELRPTIAVIEISPTRIVWEQRTKAHPFVERYVVQRDTLGMIVATTLPGQTVNKPQEIYQCEIGKENKF